MWLTISPYPFFHSFLPHLRESGRKGKDSGRGFVVVTRSLTPPSPHGQHQSGDEASTFPTLPQRQSELLPNFTTHETPPHSNRPLPNKTNPCFYQRLPIIDALQPNIQTSRKTKFEIIKSRWMIYLQEAILISMILDSLDSNNVFALQRKVLAPYLCISCQKQRGQTNIASADTIQNV